MPYIKLEPRQVFYNEGLVTLGAQLGNPDNAATPGDLNFCVSVLARAWLGSRPPSYTALSAARAALNDAADELWRKLGVPYERAKEVENGALLTPKGYVENS